MKNRELLEIPNIKKSRNFFFLKIYYGFFKGGIEIAILEINRNGGNFCSYDACGFFLADPSENFYFEGFPITGGKKIGAPKE